jgi:quinol monooxygenase YgiN
VHQFALLTPRYNESDTTSLYSIQRYTDDAAFQSHLNTRIVQDMFTWINASNIYQAPPTVYQLGSLSSTTENVSFTTPSPYEFVHSEVATAEDLFVVVRQVDYAGGAAAANASLPYWKAVVARARGDSGEGGDNDKDKGGSPSTGTLAYGVFSSSDQAGRVYIVAIYADEAAFRQNTAVEGIEEGIEVSQPLFLKLRGGFLYKPPAR